MVSKDDERFLMTNGEIDHVLKAGMEYAEGRAEAFQKECFLRFQPLMRLRLKAKALIRTCQQVFEDFSKKLQPEIAAARILGELSLCERFYFSILKMKDKDVTRDALLGDLQKVIEHIQKETIKKCGLPKHMETSIEKILSRDGFYEGIPAEEINYEKMTKISRG